MGAQVRVVPRISEGIEIKKRKLNKKRNDGVCYCYPGSPLPVQSVSHSHHCSHRRDEHCPPQRRSRHCHCRRRCARPRGGLGAFPLLPSSWQCPDLGIMADRHPQYPMMPNFNPSMLQQQQMAQQSQNQQQQQQAQDGHQGMQNFGDQQLWSTMHQLQNQFRPNNGGGMTEASNSPAMSGVA